MRHILTIIAFKCVSCAYSSEGKDLVANGRTYIGDSSCLYVSDNMNKIDCQTRCFESFREVKGNKGQTEGSFFLKVICIITFHFSVVVP